MNKRIKELYNQAFVPHTTICPDNNMPYETVLFSTEKFAELLVKECGQYLMRDEFIGRSDLDWSMVLNEHFGVK